MTHPLLTRVLTDAIHGFQNSTAYKCRHGIEVAYDDGIRVRDDCEALTKEYLDFTTPAIADRLEQALDVCQFPDCLEGRSYPRHTHDLCSAEPPHPNRHDDLWCHPYQPLVTP